MSAQDSVLWMDRAKSPPDSWAKFKIAVMELNEEWDDQQLQAIENLSKEGAHLEKIFIADAPSISTLKRALFAQHLFRIIPKSEKENLNELLAEALQRFEERQRRTAFDESERREKNQQRAKKRITTLNRQVESLHDALVAVHRAHSVGEVESLLYEALRESLRLEWLRVFFTHHAPAPEQLNRLSTLRLITVPLRIGSREIGQIIFAQKKNRPLGRFENDLLHQVADGAALAIDRLTKIEQSESLKQQWESTFDAISEPLCLTDEYYKIIRTNAAFSRVTGLEYKDLIGHHCFTRFTDGRLSPSGDFDLSHGLKVQRDERDGPHTYEVTAQKIRIKENSPPIMMVLFRDITEQQKIEKQIFESSKMAELGTIGSSIAHELNNPLGGMINFLQLIKMDLPKDSPIYDDILQMESAGHRCKEIVENLLGFSRRPDPSDATDVDLREVLRQALKITELQARSLGVTVEMHWPDAPVCVSGHFNLLAQAISHILQNGFEAVSEKLTENPRFKGHIQIELRQKNDRIHLTIIDNGVGISPELQNKILNPLFSTKSRGRNTGLGLTLAYKIIDEHRGELEIYSQPKEGTTVKIAFSAAPARPPQD